MTARAPLLTVLVSTPELGRAYRVTTLSGGQTSMSDVLSLDRVVRARLRPIRAARRDLYSLWMRHEATSMLPRNGSERHARPLLGPAAAVLRPVLPRTRYLRGQRTTPQQNDASRVPRG